MGVDFTEPLPPPATRPVVFLRWWFVYRHRIDEINESVPERSKDTSNELNAFIKQVRNVIANGR